MKLIIINGPSGSGKTTLSKIIIKNIKDGIILNTDNYYRTGIFSQILSKIVTCYFDRKISFNIKLFKRDLEFILKNGFSNFFYKYNFRSKSVRKIYKKTQNIRFVIVEGIFGQAIINSLSSNNCILIELKTDKQTCMKRVVKRDYIERGKSKNDAERDFIKAWKLYFKNNNNNNSRNYLEKIVIREKSEIIFLLNKIINILN